MIEPNGTPIHLPPNRQTKVPGLGTSQTATRQSIMPGCSNSQAQDDAGYGSIGLGGITDNMPGKTTRLDECTKTAQDSGSNASRVPFNAGTRINKGAPDTSGKSAIDGTSPEFRSTKAVLQSRHGNRDIGVQSGMLFPGIVS